ncbi:MAG TPA: GGDEF domain-containing protein, partial [Planctomycetaceae bacterium]|nr:GGDEF domain-containing protein [Planctomycetaceae bacterium]
AVFGYTLEEIPTLADWWPRAYPDPAYRQWVAVTWGKHIEQSKRDSNAFEPMEVSIQAKDGCTRVALASAKSLYGKFDGEYMV